jgi:hypothetical protein
MVDERFIAADGTITLYAPKPVTVTVGDVGVNHVVPLSVVICAHNVPLALWNIPIGLVTVVLRVTEAEELFHTVLSTPFSVTDPVNRPEIVMLDGAITSYDTVDELVLFAE